MVSFLWQYLPPIKGKRGDSTTICSHVSDHSTLLSLADGHDITKQITSRLAALPMPLKCYSSLNLHSKTSFVLSSFLSFYTT